MADFYDHVKIHIKAGDGGNGAIAFHREKYISHGGPSGGDGGNGGNVIIEIDPGMNTLLEYKNKRKFAAKNGENGMSEKFHGANAEDLVLRVPDGTVIKDAETGKIIKDMSGSEPFVVAKGGKGGFGNTHFATPTRQAPRFAKTGYKGEERDIILELKMLADVGFVGLPNVGKSTLLSVISAARPKIANYHFTTLCPMLGVVEDGDGGGFVAADIPGLIE
ncbi:MAG: Obg family GTPase CgtA, partial [Eubacteriales bacterium]